MFIRVQMVFQGNTVFAQTQILHELVDISHNVLETLLRLFGDGYSSNH